MRRLNIPATLLLLVLAVLPAAMAGAAENQPAEGAGDKTATAEAEASKTPDTIFYTDEYYFDRSSNPDAPEIAQSLCGTRCNALSGSYDSYLSPGGWRLIQVGRPVKKVVDLDNPFLQGKCVCVGRVYRVTRENVFDPEWKKTQQELIRKRVP